MFTHIMYEVYLHSHGHTNIVSNFIYKNGTLYIDGLFVQHSVVSHSSVIIAHKPIIYIFGDGIELYYIKLDPSSSIMVDRMFI